MHYISAVSNDHVLSFSADSQGRRTLSTAEKSKYISAVKCLQSEAGQMGHLFDGVRSRYDDYFAVHINLTEQYHFTVCLEVLMRISSWSVLYLTMGRRDPSNRGTGCLFGNMNPT